MRGTLALAVIAALAGLASVGAIASTPLPIRGYPSCPGPKVGGPGRGPDGDRLYVRVTDTAGNDLEIWCISGFFGFHYEFRRSFPTGPSKVIDVCEFDRGFNDVKLQITGTTTTGTLPNGGTSITVTVCYGAGCSGDTNAVNATNARGTPVTVGVSSRINLFTPALLGMSGFGISSVTTMVVNH